MPPACVALLIALAAPACGGGSGGSARDVAGSCADLIRHDGSEYAGSGVRMPARLGAPLGRAERVPCGEIGGSVEIARIEGVDPADAVAERDEPMHVYLASRLVRERPELSPALAQIVLGPSCTAAAPFAVAGQLVGESNLDEPHYVQIQVDEVGALGRGYLGLLLDLQVRPSTQGLNERPEFREFARIDAPTRRLRAIVRCVEAERPNETFLAEAVEAAAPEAPKPAADEVPKLCGPDEAEPPCGPGAELGVSYLYNLYTHCGLEYAIFDGRLWVLDPPLTDGSGNPPLGWGNPTDHGLMRLLAPDIAEFRNQRVAIRFEPAPPGYERPGCL